jgi:hypothetical protein
MTKKAVLPFSLPQSHHNKQQCTHTPLGIRTSSSLRVATHVTYPQLFLSVAVTLCGLLSLALSKPTSSSVSHRHVRPEPPGEAHTTPRFKNRKPPASPRPLSKCMSSFTHSLIECVSNSKKKKHTQVVSRATSTDFCLCSAHERSWSLENAASADHASIWRPTQRHSKKRLRFWRPHLQDLLR